MIYASLSRDELIMKYVDMVNANDMEGIRRSFGYPPYYFLDPDAVVIPVAQFGTADFYDNCGVDYKATLAPWYSYRIRSRYRNPDTVPYSGKEILLRHVATSELIQITITHVQQHTGATGLVQFVDAIPPSFTFAQF